MYSLSVNIGDDIVQRTTDGYQVGNLSSAAKRVQSAYERQARRTIVQAVGILVSFALQIYAELTAASFYGSIIRAFRYADNRFHLFLVRTFRNVVYQLFDDVEAFQNLVHTYHEAGKAVAFCIGDFLEVHFVVHAIRNTFAHVAGPAAGTSRTSGRTESNGIFTAQYTYSFQALLDNDIVDKHVEIFLEIVPHVGDEFFHAVYEVGVQVGLNTANCVIIQDKASAAGLLKNVEDLFTAEDSWDYPVNIYTDPDASTDDEVLANGRKVYYDVQNPSFNLEDARISMVLSGSDYVPMDDASALTDEQIEDLPFLSAFDQSASVVEDDRDSDGVDELVFTSERGWNLEKVVYIYVKVSIEHKWGTESIWVHIPVYPHGQAPAGN